MWWSICHSCPGTGENAKLHVQAHCPCAARLYNLCMGNARIITIILADDHTVVRAGIRQFLEKDGGIRVVAETGDGKTACELIQLHQPDLALLDIQMPRMNGLEVTRWLRKEGLQTLVLILSAFDDIPYVQAALKSGADGYVVKTADPGEIIRSVYRVFQGEKIISNAIQDNLVGQQRLQSDLNRAPLSLRELEVLSLAAEGLTNRQIAGRLEISERTVQNHMANIFHNLGVASRTEAVMKAISVGLIIGSAGKQNS